MSYAIVNEHKNITLLVSECYVKTTNLFNKQFTGHPSSVVSCIIHERTFNIFWNIAGIWIFRLQEVPPILAPSRTVTLSLPRLSSWHWSLLICLVHMYKKACPIGIKYFMIFIISNEFWKLFLFPFIQGRTIHTLTFTTHIFCKLCYVFA